MAASLMSSRLCLTLESGIFVLSDQLILERCSKRASEGFGSVKLYERHKESSFERHLENGLACS